ncbi:MAG: hypothetical protein GQ574_06180 [Crocinitomix sp.]|nr:hypothetical protein [Crocinitomix sp.]
MKVRYIILIFVGFALTACNKTPIPELPEGNDPIYTLKGQIDGVEIDYSVGLESVVLNRGVKNESGLVSYYGEMESVTNNEKIRVEFIQLETPLAAGRTEVFNGLTVPFMVHEPTKISFDFGAFGGGQDGFFTFEPEGGPEVKNSGEHELDEFGYLHFKGRFRDVGLQQYNFTIKNGFENSELVSMFGSFGGEDSIHLNSEGEYPFNEWYIDGLLVGTDKNYDGPISTGIHRINHRVMDINSNQSETDRLVRFNGGKQIWEMKIVYKEEYPFETYNYGRVIVSMFKNGEWYSSDRAVGNKGSNAKIENVELVSLGQGELPLVAFDIDFDAMLLNDSMSDSLSLSNMGGKFVVGLE